MVLVNKWDIAQEKSQQSITYMENTIRQRFAPFSDFPIIFGSALTKQRIYKVLEEAIKVYQNRKRIIPTSQLNNAMQEIIGAYPPPATKGKMVKIKYVTMLEAGARAFVRVLLQFATVDQGPIQTLPRKPDSRALGLERHANQPLFPSEISERASAPPPAYKARNNRMLRALFIRWQLIVR